MPINFSTRNFGVKRKIITQMLKKKIYFARVVPHRLRRKSNFIETRASSSNHENTRTHSAHLNFFYTWRSLLSHFQKC